MPCSDNGRHGRAVTGAGNRPLKSLSDMLKGKSGPVPSEPAGQARGLLRALRDRHRPGTEAQPMRFAQEDGAWFCSSHLSFGASKSWATSTPSAAPRN